MLMPGLMTPESQVDSSESHGGTIIGYRRGKRPARYLENRSQGRGRDAALDEKPISIVNELSELGANELFKNPSGYWAEARTVTT